MAQSDCLVQISLITLSVSLLATIQNKKSTMQMAYCRRIAIKKLLIGYSTLSSENVDKLLAATILLLWADSDLQVK